MENTQIEVTEQFSLEVETKENVLLGVLGAFLGSLAGGILYFIIYQVGFIAGISGFVAFFLAKLLYDKFSGSKNSIKGIVISVIFALIMILAGEFFALVFALYEVWADFGIDFITAMMETPAIIANPEVLPDVIKEVAIAIVLCIIATAGSISQALKERKAAQID